MEKKFSAKALSYGFPRLDIEGVMPYDCVSLSYSVLLWDPSYKGLDDFLKEGDVKSRMVALKGEHFVLDE